MIYVCHPEIYTNADNRDVYIIAHMPISMLLKCIFQEFTPSVFVGTGVSLPWGTLSHVRRFNLAQTCTRALLPSSVYFHTCAGEQFGEK